MTENKNTTITEFECPFTIEERYAMVCSGVYSVFEMINANGDVTGYRGYKKYCGVSGIYDNYKDALEASFILEKEEENDIGTG